LGACNGTDLPLLFLLETESTQGHSLTGMIISVKNSNDNIGNRARELPACSAVLQPTASPCTPRLPKYTKNKKIKQNPRQTMYVQPNMEARSRNHCCRGRAISITYSECEFVILVIHHALSMRRIILPSVAYLIVPYFPTLSDKQRHFRRENLLNTKHLMRLSLQLSSEILFIFFSVTLRLNAGHGLLILEVSRSHTTTHHSR